MTVQRRSRTGGTLQEHTRHRYFDRSPDEIVRIVRQSILGSYAQYAKARILSDLDCPREYLLRVTITDNPGAVAIAADMGDPISGDGKIVTVELCHPSGGGTITIP